MINSGSDGNCTILNGCIAIDLGISYRKLGEYAKKIKLVLLTHEHHDHFNRTTIRKLIAEHPKVKYACLDYLASRLVEIVPKKSIYVLDVNKPYDLGICKVAAFYLKHDVPNCGWRVMIGDEKCIYATDTNSLKGISAKDYDLYLIEANYDIKEALEKIRQKQRNGEFAYEVRAINNHLSRQQCDRFLAENIGPHSEYRYMHQHKGP